MKPATPIDAQKLIQNLEAFTIATMDGNEATKITITDKAKIEELKTFFQDFDKKENLIKSIPSYSLKLYTSEQIVNLRVTNQNILLSDIAASSIQTGYAPKKPDLIKFLEQLIASATQKPK